MRGYFGIGVGGMKQIFVICVVVIGLLSGCGEPDDLPTLHTKAEKGDMAAQSTLGRMYGMGDGVKQDYKESAKWYRRAGEQGNYYAQMFLGTMLQKGMGIPQDDEEAYFWLKLARKTALEAGKKDWSSLDAAIAEVSGKLATDKIKALDEKIAAWKPHAEGKE